jgi:hypothetical protein
MPYWELSEILRRPRQEDGAQGFDLVNQASVVCVVGLGSGINFGEQDEGNGIVVGDPPDFPKHLEPVFPAHLETRDNQIVLSDRQANDRLVPILGDIDLVTGLLQLHGQKSSGCWIVIREEDTGHVNDIAPADKDEQLAPIGLGRPQDERWQFSHLCPPGMLALSDVGRWLSTDEHH